METGSVVNQLCRADTSEVQTYQAKAWITLSIGEIARKWISVRETSGKTNYAFQWIEIYPGEDTIVGQSPLEDTHLF